MRHIILSVLASAAVLAASPALAQSVAVDNGTTTTSLSSGGSTTIFFNGQDNGTVYSGLSSNLLLTFTGFVNNVYNFNYTLNNTSTAAAGGRVVSFGFDDNPNATLAITGGSVFTNVSSGSISNSFSVEDCLTAGNNCSGGGNGGVAYGGSTSGSFSLNTGSNGLLTLSNFIDRYQSTNVTPGGSGVGISTGAVPEPGTWAMMLVGFGAAGFSLRRHRKVPTLQAA